jgi:transcriptional antiterminator
MTEMYRVSKVLNNNGVIAIDMDENKEYVILGKGVGFGKKVSQRFDKPEGCTTYRLEQETERGSAKELVKGIEPEYLEIADEILTESQKVFGDSIDRGILFPLADHISFAVARIRRNEQISNPLTEDIKVLFYSEFKVAETLKTILRERLQIEIDDHEVGYVALHIHSAIGDEKVSVAMQTARAVRECIDMIEKATGKPIDVLSLSYNRLMNHMKYMVARASTGEKLNLDMNEYMLDQYPQAYKVATDICKNLEGCIGHNLDETETGYLAMHIQRVYKDAV